MFRSESVRNPAGHRKAAPLLAVSGTREVPDTMPDTGNAALARLRAKVSGCPAEMPPASRAHTHARACAPAHEHTHISNGHPDTFNTGAGFRCPLPKFVADTAGHLGFLPDTTMSETKKPMREAMPTVAAWIDNLREAFGAEAIDGSIRAGMRGVPGKFHARENGREIGTKFEEGK